MVMTETKQTRLGALVAAAALLMLAGCSGSSRGAPAVAPVVPRFAYVANFEGTVSVYAVDAGSGRLRLASLARAGTRPSAVAVDPAARFAYVANSGSSDVSAFRIDSASGALNPVVGSPFPAGLAPSAVAVDPGGTRAYVLSSGQDAVSAYLIEPSSGALTRIPCGAGAACIGADFAVGGMAPQGLTLGPAGRFLYVANHNSDNVSVFAVDAATGALAPVPGSPFAAGIHPASVAVDPSGRFAYVANNGGSISAYAIQGVTGVLTPVAGSPFAAGAGGLYSITVDRGGRFVYAVNGGGSSDMFAFALDAATGALTPVPGSPFPSQGFPTSVVADPSRRFLYTANFESGDLSVLGLDAGSGALTTVQTIAARNFPSGIALVGGVTPVRDTPRYAYVANTDPANAIGPWYVSQYTVGTGGTLAPMTPFTVTTLAWPVSVRVHPSARFAYVVASGQASVNQYTVGPSGALTPMAGSVLAGDNPSDIAVDPTGRYAYVAIMGTGLAPGAVAQFTIGPDGGLTAMTPAAVTAGILPQAITVDPTGRFAYAANGDGSVSQYLIGGDGGLAPLAPATVTAGLRPYAVTVDPDGKFAYVVNHGDDVSPGTVSQYAVTRSGALQPLAPATVTAGVSSNAVTVDPAARWAYVANGDGTISRYAIGPGGALAPVPAAVAAAPVPEALILDPSGQFAYVANGVGRVDQYTVGADGTFTPMTQSSIPAGVFPSSIAVAGTLR